MPAGGSALEAIGRDLNNFSVKINGYRREKKFLVCQLEVNAKGYNRRKPASILYKRGVFEEFMLKLKLDELHV